MKLRGTAMPCPFSYAMSPAYASVRPRLIEELRAFAASGHRELSFLVDADSGEVIDRQEGELDEVTPDWTKVRAGQRIVALHSHPRPGGPGGEDWDVLCIQPQVCRLEIVDTEAVWVVEKPIGWEFQTVVTHTAQRRFINQRGEEEWAAPLCSLFDRALSDVRRDPVFTGRDAATQIEETNRRLRKHVFLRSFRFWKEVLFL